MRHHQKDQLIVLNGVILGAEEVGKAGNLTQPGNAGLDQRLLLVLNAAQDARLALAQTDDVIDAALADDRLGHAADGHRTALRGDLDLDLERDIAVKVHGRRHFDIHAHVLVLELRVDQRADHGGRRARLVGAGGDGNLGSDLHHRLLAVSGPNAWILQNLGVSVCEQKVGRSRSHGYGKIRRLQVSQLVECGAGCAGG